MKNVTLKGAQGPVGREILLLRGEEGGQGVDVPSDLLGNRAFLNVSLGGGSHSVRPQWPMAGHDGLGPQS